MHLFTPSTLTTSASSSVRAEQVHNTMTNNDEPQQQGSPILPSSMNTNHTKTPLFVGLNMPSVEGKSNRQVVDQALHNGYDMITCRITSRGYRKRITKIYEEKYGTDHSLLESPALNVEAVRRGGNKLETIVPAPDIDEVLIQPGTHVSNTIALASPWVEIDAKTSALASLSLQVLQHEFTYAAFCGVPYIMIMGPKRRTHIAQYAQAVNSLISQNPFLQVIIHLPFNEEPTQGPNGAVIPPPDYLSIWDLWQQIRTVCNYSPNLSVALQIPSKQSLRPYVISRWFTEPVTMLVLNPKVFVANQKGFPVLPKSSQQLLFQFFKKHCFVLFEHQEKTKFNGGDDSFLMYLRHLHSIAPPPSTAEQFASGYADFLQAPLQPLVDNLESATYEVFEQDPVKYNQYEKAIYHAILDRPNKRIVMAVVGAGRGAIVDKALNAAKTADRRVKIYAIEKNANAFIYLCQRQKEEWGDKVELHKGDMRTWEPTEAINIMISELLGSLGDNELSPECLDGLDQFLDPSDGVMIPSAYSAHITPIMSPKLYTRALATPQQPKTTNIPSSAASSVNGSMIRPGSHTNGSLHVPYVVMMQQVDMISDSIKQYWQFEHPSPNKLLPLNQHNTRHCRKTFSIPHKCALHGFAGYFEAVLYKDIELSTRPDNIDSKSKDMISWFPLWFPLSQPMYLVDESEIDFSLWRCTDGRKVWYEWCCESFAVIAGSTVQESPSGFSNNSKRSSVNSAMRRIRTGASELHNSGGQFFAMTL